MQTTSYLYRPILKKAFDITRKYSNLWFFGLFAVLVSAGGEYEIISRAFYNNADEGGIINAFVVSFQSGWQEGLSLVNGNFWSNLWQLMIDSPSFVAMALFFFLFIITLTLFVIWLAITSQIALIKGSSLAGKNKKMPFAEGFDFANKNFWPIVAVIAILKIVLFVMFGLLGWEILLLSGGGILARMLYILSFIVFVAVVLLVSFILKYQTFFILLKKKKFLPALKAAWEIFMQNWLITLEMGLLMFGVYLVAASLSAFIITFCLGIPVFVIPLYATALPALLKILFTIISAVLMVAGISWVTAVMTVFQWAGWTSLFERLAGDDDSVSKLERIGEEFKQLPNVILGK